MAKTDPVLEHLGKVRLFRADPGGARRHRRAGQAVPFPAGSVIVEEGAQGGRFYLITAGEADVIVHDQSVLTLGEGGYFGEIALYRRRPPHRTLQRRHRRGGPRHRGRSTSGRC